MKPLSVAVIGAGRLGGFHAAKYAALKGVHLLAVVDPDQRRAAAVAAATGAQALSDYHAVLGRLDAVSIATPTISHAAISSDFLRAGAHVLVEKPITVHSAEGHALLALAQRQQRLLQIGHVERFNPAWQLARPLLQGPMRFVEARRLAPFPRRGLDVDVVRDLMIHDLDILLDLVDGEPLQIDACGATVLSQHWDIAHARLRFADGCVASLSASRVDVRPQRRLHCFFSSGRISVDFARYRVDRYQVAAEQERQAVSVQRQCVAAGDALAAQIAAFVAAVRDKRWQQQDGLRACRALELAEWVVAALEDSSGCWRA